MSYSVGVRSALTRFYLFRGLGLTWLYVPFQWFYLRSQGLTATELMVLNAIFCVAAVLFEVPTGALADRLGRRVILAAGSLFSVASCVIFLLLSSSFFWLAGANIFAALAMTCISGADSAYLFEALRYQNQSERYRRAESLSSAIRLTVAAVGGLAGALMVASGFHIAALYLVTAVLSGVATLVALSLPEPWRQQVRNSHQRSAQLAQPFSSVLREAAIHAHRGFRLVGNNRQLIALLLLSGALFPVLRVGLFLDQPFIRYLGFGSATLGAVFAVKDLVAAIAAAATATLLLRFGEVRLLFALPTAACIALALMSLSTAPAGVILVLIPTFAFGIFSPLVRVFVNRRLNGTHERATVLSIEGMARRLGFAIFSPLVGAAIDLWSLSRALTLSALWAAVVCVLVLVLPFRERRNRVRRQNRRGTRSSVAPELPGAPDVQPG